MTEWTDEMIERAKDRGQELFNLYCNSDPSRLQTPEEMFERWSGIKCQCDPDVGHFCERCHDTRVLRVMIDERNELRESLTEALSESDLWEQTAKRYASNSGFENTDYLRNDTDE